MLKKDLLKWVDEYVEEYKTNRPKEIKSQRQNAMEEYNALTEEVVSLHQLVNSTQSSLEHAKSIDAALLRKIQKCFRENDVEDLDVQKHTAMMLEKELNRNQEDDIVIKFGGYQASNMGQIHSPRS